MSSPAVPIKRRHGFSPNVKPFIPSPMLNAVSLDAMSDANSCQSTPKIHGSPALSTPGCNPMAKPYLPPSQQIALLPSREDEKGRISVQAMLALRSPVCGVTFPSDVPDEVLSTSANSSVSWLSDVCRSLQGHEDSSSTASVKSAADEQTPHSSPLPPQPATMMAFMKAKKRAAPKV